MNQSLKILANRIYPLDDAVMNELLLLFTPVKVEKRGLLLKEGQLTEDLFLLKWVILEVIT